MDNKALITQKSTEIVARVTNDVQVLISTGGLLLPDDYSAANALKSAWLKLQDIVDRNQRPALEVCTQASIHNALLDMVVQGLNPMKNQCYFVVYGDKLVCLRSYFGAQSTAIMVSPDIGEFAAEVIYEKDVLKFNIVKGKRIIQEHSQEWGDIDKKKIVGAYCLVLSVDGEIMDTVLMTMDEIKQSWAMSKTGPLDEQGRIKPGSTHGKFTAEMCRRTVINRACKKIINTSSDATITGKTIRRVDAMAATIEAEYQLKDEMAENANQPEPEPEELAPKIDKEAIVKKYLDIIAGHDQSTKLAAWWTMTYRTIKSELGDSPDGRGGGPEYTKLYSVMMDRKKELSAPPPLKPEENTGVGNDVPVDQEEQSRVATGSPIGDNEIVCPKDATIKNITNDCIRGGCPDMTSCPALS